MGIFDWLFGGKYKNFKREGLWKTYHKNGQLKFEGNYKKRVLDLIN